MPSHRFTRAERLKHQGDFLRVLKDGKRFTRGPLMVTASIAPEPLKKTRLGIRISRRCGNAVVRNRVKRLLREAFRLVPHDALRSVDLIVTVKPHEPLTLTEYQGMMKEILISIAARFWKS